MILLIGFAFLAGIVTVLSPCILPILPIVLSSSIGNGEVSKSRPFGVVTGFVASFTFFTLFLSTIVKSTGLSADFLRWLSVVVIAAFGISLLIPQFQVLLERLFSRLSGLVPQGGNRSGFGGGFILGLSLGLLWTPCVGPILASVISLAITGSVTLHAFLITLAYSLGTAVPMFFIILSGQNALQRVPWLLANTSKIQKAFGVLMILTAVAIHFNVDRSFQTWVLNTFPQYGAGLTKFEESGAIQDQLNSLQTDGAVKKEDMGKPMFELLENKGTLAPELIPGGQWFNSEPLTLKELRGKVVIVDFWTYSCINCQRTFPYLRDWWEKYKDDGLVIIGVHAPEFEFEKNADNLAKAIEDFDLRYPIVQDNDFETWRAYNNRFWPAKYIIDKDGYIRYQHFGEGKYDETEEVIQTLLKETGATNLPTDINNPDYDVQTKTPETYLGYERLANFSSPESIKKDTLTTYTIPASVPSNTMAYGGEWTVAGEYAKPEPGAKLAFRFDAKQVFLVMRPVAGPITVRVMVDGKQAGLGDDVDEHGLVTVDSDSLYKLVNLALPGAHELRLEFVDGGVEVYAFTFG